MSIIPFETEKFNTVFPLLENLADLGICLENTADTDNVLSWRESVANELVSWHLQEQAENYERCGEPFRLLVCGKCGYKHVVKFHCKLRICPDCQRRRSMKVRSGYRNAFKSYNRVRFLTLTLKNVADLASGVEKIRSCFTKLRHRKLYKRRIKGGLYGIEPPVGKDGLWNIHLHSLIVGDYIPQDKLSDDWKAITGDSSIVYVKELKMGGNAGSPVGYLTKYIAKGLEEKDNAGGKGLNVPIERIGEYASVLEDVRLVQPFGEILGKSESDKEGFDCPKCGERLWNIYDVNSGALIFSELGRLSFDGLDGGGSSWLANFLSDKNRSG